MNKLRTNTKKHLDSKCSDFETIPWEWAKATTTKTSLRILPKPFDRITVGANPISGIEKELAKSYGAIINISCQAAATFYPAYQGQRMYWYPLSDNLKWDLVAFYWFKRIMDFHYAEGCPIYVHCEIGANRSPAMLASWLFSIGVDESEAARLTGSYVLVVLLSARVKELYKIMNLKPGRAFDKILADIWYNELTDMK